MASMIAEAQAMAIAYPCRLAVETVHPRYLWRGRDLILRMTVNTGYE